MQPFSIIAKLLFKSDTMKYILGLLTVTLLILSCDKDNDKGNNKLSSEDLIASQSMAGELVSMQQALNSLRTAPDITHRQYWDNQYHYHDSLYWHYHANYHHEHYTHDDHHHEWLPYDPTINHSHHYHHTYPNHHNDSLVTSPNNHHHDNHDHHFPGHDLDHHHTLDSLHHIHHHYHP